MNFIGTREGEKVTGEEAIVRGMAEGGGLYVPESFPEVSSEELSSMIEMDYPERAAVILEKFFDVPHKELSDILKAEYEKFEGEDPVPLVRIEDGLYVLELFRGPTCSAKDLSFAVFPYLLEKACKTCGVKEKLLLLSATNGDAGKAALESFRDKQGIRALVFYPEEGVSKMQKLQLSAQEGENVNVVAVRGSFDDCQSDVKKFLRSQEQRETLAKNGYRAISANSVNIGLLLPQVAAYFSAYLDLVSSGQIQMGALADFSVPSGNFTAPLAVYYAKRMGLPVGTIVCASNHNNVVSEFLNKGTFERKKSSYRTMSPSLDINMPSNLERLLYGISEDCSLVVERMKALGTAGRYSLRAEELKTLREIFFGGWANEEDTVECVYEFFEEFNYPLDTQTGAVLHAARLYSRKRAEANAEFRPMVVVSSASPYKFPQAVYYALTGNDVKDSFKGVKRIHLISAMKVPDAIKQLRYKMPRFKAVVSPEKINEEILQFAQ